MNQLTLVANRKFKGNRLRHRFHHAFTLFDQNTPEPEIVEALEITGKCLFKAKAAYLSLFPDKAQQIISVSSRGYKCLVDECLPPSCVLPATSMLGLSAHVNHLGKAGTKDPDLFRWAIEQGYSVILSADMAFKVKGRKNPFRSRDLTGVATAFTIDAVFDEIAGSKFSIPRAKLPTVIRFSKKNNTHEDIGRLLSIHLKAIEFALRRKISPYITLSESGVTLGPSYKNIFDEFMAAPDSKKTDRAMRWKEDWVNRIKAKYGGKNLSRKKMKKIVEIAEMNARHCFVMRGDYGVRSPRFVR